MFDRASLDNFEFKLRHPVCTILPNILWNPSTYVLNNKVAYNTDRHSECVLSYSYSTIFSKFDQYLTVFPCPSGYSCSNSHPTCSSHDSVSSVQLPLGNDRANIERGNNPCCRVPGSSILVFFSRPKWKVLFFSNLGFSSAALGVTFSKSCQGAL